MSIFNDLKLQFKMGDATTKLIFWNVGLFLFSILILGIQKLFRLNFDFLDFISLSSNPKDLLWKPWSVITYAFFHSYYDIFHILFNMLLLNFSGKLFTTFFTQKQLVNFFFVSAIFGGAIYIISYVVFPGLSNQTVSLVGASGAIMAILVATATYQPMMEVRLVLIGNVKLIYLVLLLLVIDLIQLPMNNTGGHLAHLGGSVFGFLFVKQIENGFDITQWFGNLIRFFEDLIEPKKRTPFKSVHVNPKKGSKPVSKIVTKDVNQQKIDLILDKISHSGYDSLSQAEKEFLFQAGK